MKGRIYIKLPVPWACPVLPELPSLFFMSTTNCLSGNILLLMFITQSQSIWKCKPLRSTEALMEAHVSREKQPIYLCPLLDRLLDLIIATPSPRIGHFTLHSKPLSTVQLCKITNVHRTVPVSLFHHGYCGDSNCSSIYNPTGAAIIWHTVCCGKIMRALEFFYCVTK